MDQFLSAAYLLAVELLPILGVAVLIILMVLLIKGIKLTDKTIETLDRTHDTMDLVDKSIEKIQTPLDTAAKVAKTVDEVHDVSVKVVKDGAAYLRKNGGEIKEKINQMVNKTKKKTDPEDVSEVL